ncbi:slit homolog 2 protein-like [Argiope bruennichi]|uniref:slit homolog 2 protein-like n=1 Tax=Argiope bruennichi TaxID=94029 RepID=UPI002493EF68|nr:slit homolog 2 protein-like [Argiope bruennichi]
MKFFPVILVLFIGIQFVSSDEDVPKIGCPPKYVVEPCVCESGPHPVLICKHIDDPEVLVKIFDRSTPYWYQEFHLEESVLQYLPHDMFQGVQILRIYLKNVTLVQLFDEPPENLQMVEGLHIENSNVFRGMSWEQLQNFTSLRLLSVYFNIIPYLGSEFSTYVSDSLTQLTLYDTQTELIKPGSLMKYKDLDKVAIDACGITELTRKIFPRPFNGRFLYFNDNKLSSIPDDLFTDMPNLHTVGLRGNQLRTVPAIAFEGSFSKLKFLWLDGNPLHCDCRILWLIKNKPFDLLGICYSPKIFEGRKLKDIQASEMVCPLP